MRGGDRRLVRWEAPVVAAAALALVLRAPFVPAPLGVDEGGLAFVAEHWARHGTSLYGNLWLDRPPLLVLLVRLATAAGGAIGLRVLGAVAAVVLVVLVARLARMLGGTDAARAAALAAAVLASSVALDAVYAPAELLAVVPATASVLCLVAAARSGGAARLVAAGALATTAALVKQSFLDAAVAGVVFLAASAWHRPERLRWTAGVAWVAGAAIPLLAVGAIAAAGWFDARALPYALVGFRLDALRALAGAGPALTVRLADLAGRAVVSGLALALAGVPVGLTRLRAEPVVRWTVGAWLAGGLVGILGGGTYWPHYLIQVVPVAAVLFGVATAGGASAVRRVAAGAVVFVALVVAAGASLSTGDSRAQGAERAVGSYIRAHARPGDTQYVLYARANVLFYAGLPTPFPYDWSLMVRARPGARTALYRLLASPARPTWLVPWQEDDRWRLDRDGIVDALLRRYYRPRAVVDRHVILRRIG